MITAAEQVQAQDIEGRLSELASREVGSWIEKREFEALSKEQRQTVTLAMEERGLYLSELFGRLHVKRSVTSKVPIEFCRVAPDIWFQVTVGEPRLPHADDVAFIIWNTDGEEDAWNKLREYLAALQTLPLNLEPRDFDEDDEG